MVVQHNLAALSSNRQLGITNGSSMKSMEKLSSGYRINRAADDAAGLAISEKMRRQIRGLTQAAKNAQDGISLIQVADGALSEDHAMLQRMTELAVKAANGSLQDVDREYIDEEMQKLKEELDATTKKVTFNEITLFPDDGFAPGNAESAANVWHYEYCFGQDGVITVSSPDAAEGTGAIAEGTGADRLAEKLAEEMIPNAAAQILEKFPSLAAATTNDVKLGLEIQNIDGKGTTLARAWLFYSPSTGNRDMWVEVDISDFTDASLESESEMSKLGSTIAHELMHTVMQNTMPEQMLHEFPTWFKEGTAQLTGGGFPTNWNWNLQHMGIADPDDDSKDDEIKAYLQTYTVAGRVYGHGYLAAAYMGYLASGGSSVDGDSIASGMDHIFADVASGSTLADAVLAQTGKSMDDIVSAINNGDDDAVEFVRKLVAETGADGAGSVIASGGLSAKGSEVIGTGKEGISKYVIDSERIKIAADAVGGEDGINQLTLQVGSEVGDEITLKLYQMSAQALGVGAVNVLTQEDAKAAIDSIKGALQKVSSVRSYYGATQNRLEHTINNLHNVIENTTSAESVIRDTDMSTEMVKMSNLNILSQAGMSVLAQANRSNQGILSLLQ